MSTDPRDRTIARLQARVAALESAWQREPWTWEGRIAARYSHRHAVEGAARKYGAALGEAFCELLAARLVEVDVALDGSRLSIDSARGLVARWSVEGPKMRAVGRAA